MALQLIPKEWLEDVCRVLATEEFHLIQRTKDFSEKFGKSFPSGCEAEVEKAFLDHLSREPVTGCPVKMDYPVGETWEFFFHFKGMKTYGKIMLLGSRKKVRLYSAHRPEKPRLRCE